jgi:excisionase family DNA binding protein
MDQRYLTPQMVSKILHIGMNKTYKLFKIKGFPAVRIANQWLVKEKDLEKFLDEYRGSFISL